MLMAFPVYNAERTAALDDCTIGGIAQLVERCFCTADVSGSSPLTSTRQLLVAKHAAVYVSCKSQGRRQHNWHADQERVLQGAPH